MASTLNLTTSLAGDHYLIQGSLAAGGTLPGDIFIYTNLGDGTQGEFYGTCNMQELGRLAIFTPGVPQPVFGNKYLRYSQVKIKVGLQSDPQAVINALVTNVKSLSTAYASQTTTSGSYTIP